MRMGGASRDGASGTGSRYDCYMAPSSSSVRIGGAPPSTRTVQVTYLSLLLARLREQVLSMLLCRLSRAVIACFIHSLSSSS